MKKKNSQMMHLKKNTWGLVWIRSQTEKLEGDSSCLSVYYNGYQTKCTSTRTTNNCVNVVTTMYWATSMWSGIMISAYLTLSRLLFKRTFKEMVL